MGRLCDPLSRTGDSPGGPSLTGRSSARTSPGPTQGLTCRTPQPGAWTPIARVCPPWTRVSQAQRPTRDTRPNRGLDFEGGRARRYIRGCADLCDDHGSEGSPCVFETIKGLFIKYFTMSESSVFRFFRSSGPHIRPFSFPGGSTARQRRTSVHARACLLNAWCGDPSYFARPRKGRRACAGPWR